jgi:hypothetical protein
MIDITPKQLRRAADLKERIDALQDELNEILGSEVSTPTANVEKPKRRKFSAATKAKMRAAQRARWAKLRGTAPEAGPVKRRKRKMSARGLANIRAGVAKRMAAQGRAVAAKPAKRARRKMSAEGLANIRAAQKARWAKAKKAG